MHDEHRQTLAVLDGGLRTPPNENRRPQTSQQNYENEDQKHLAVFEHRHEDRQEDRQALAVLVDYEPTVMAKGLREDTTTRKSPRPPKSPGRRGRKTKKSYRTTRDHRNFMARTSDCYNNLKKRIGRKLTFRLETLREIVSIALLDNCRFCQQRLTIRNFSLDHSTPRSRGGSNDITNLDITCKSCNTCKGALTWPEFQSLMALIVTWEPKARQDVLARLKAGSRRFAK